MQAYDLIPTKKRRVGAEEFLKIFKSRKKDIRSTSFIPPALGDGGFGFFEIEYKNTIFCPVNESTER